MRKIDTTEWEAAGVDHLAELKIDSEVDGEVLQIQYEIFPAMDLSDPRQMESWKGLSSVEERLAATQEKADALNTEIDRLTNHADGVDYTIAVAGGIICGMIDAFAVGELGLFKNASDEAKERFKNDKADIHTKMNKFIEDYARKKGYKGKGLKGAIAFLEKAYPVAQDNTWSGEGVSSAKTHHLDDLAHHPTLLGLLSAIVVQYLRVAVFIDKNGEWHMRPVAMTKDELIKNLAPVLIAGIIKWIVNLAERNIEDFEESVPKPIQALVRELYKVPVAISVLKTADNWFGHLVSDMGGSKNTPDGGAGIPGLFLSFLKELSALPILKDSGLPEYLNKLYQGTKDSPLTDKLDLRTELTVLKEQGMPVLVNEALVRSLFFIRHLVLEIKENEGKNINWDRVLPFRNRTIIRMFTISTGVFTAVDMADAAIHAAKSGAAAGGPTAFLGAMALRVNFVGVGRFVVAAGTDMGMGIRKAREEGQLRAVMAERLELLNAKVYYKVAVLENSLSDVSAAQEDMWVAAEDTARTLACAYKDARRNVLTAANDLEQIFTELERCGNDVEAFRENHPDEAKALLDILNY